MLGLITLFLTHTKIKGDNPHSFASVAAPQKKAHAFLRQLASGSLLSVHLIEGADAVLLAIPAPRRAQDVFEDLAHVHAGRNASAAQRPKK